MTSIIRLTANEFLPGNEPNQPGIMGDTLNLGEMNPFIESVIGKTPEDFFNSVPENLIAGYFKEDDATYIFHLERFENGCLIERKPVDPDDIQLYLEWMGSRRPGGIH